MRWVVRKAPMRFCAARQVVASYPQQLTNPQEQGSSRQPDFFFVLFRVSPQLL